MSAYVEIAVDIRDESALLEALNQMGFPRGSLIVEPGHRLEGYEGARRTQTADITIPRRLVGTMSNDIGFHRTEKGFELVISEYDQSYSRSRYRHGFANTLRHHYGVAAATKQLQCKGYRVEQTKQPDGAVVLQAVRWR